MACPSRNPVESSTWTTVYSLSSTGSTTPYTVLPSTTFDGHSGLPASSSTFLIEEVSSGPHRTAPDCWPTSICISRSPAISIERSCRSCSSVQLRGSFHHSSTTFATSGFVHCQLTPESPTQNDEYVSTIAWAIGFIRSAGIEYAPAVSRVQYGTSRFCRPALR